MINRGKRVFNAVNASLTTVMIVFMLLAGCSSTPAPLPPKVAAGLKDLHAEGVSVKGQIEKTVGALKDLISKPDADHAAQFERYTQELGVLETKVTNQSLV